MYQTNNQMSVKWGNELLKPYSQGFGGLGLPGDYSSSSRFVKASFLRNHIDLDVDYEGGNSRMLPYLK